MTFPDYPVAWQTCAVSSPLSHLCQGMSPDLVFLPAKVDFPCKGRQILISEDVSFPADLNPYDCHRSFP